MTYPDITEGCLFIQASKTSTGSNLPPSRVVIHCTISRTQIGGAQATANGFAQPTAGGSAHYTTDPGTVVQSVREDTIAWHAPPNARSIGIEQTDLCVWQCYPTQNAGQMDSRFANNPAAFAARWSRPEWQQMLARTALVTRVMCDKYSIPIVRIGVADLKAGRKGICGHRDVSLAFGQSDHIDPYASTTASGDFPWDQFLDLVSNPEKAVAIMGGTITPEDDMPAPQDLWNYFIPVGKDSSGNVIGTSAGQLLAQANQQDWSQTNALTALKAQVDGLVTAVKNLSQSNGVNITEDNIKEWLANAVADSVSVAGDVHLVPKVQLVTEQAFFGQVEPEQPVDEAPSVEGEQPAGRVTGDRPVEGLHDATTDLSDREDQA